ncbi:MAG: hypothetical protein CMJ19_04540 [Phycisphaeraceae bacterium]|nr:hypothetical protein [Phycisphaeraceae bacterium]
MNYLAQRLLCLLLLVGLTVFTGCKSSTPAGQATGEPGDQSTQTTAIPTPEPETSAVMDTNPQPPVEGDAVVALPPAESATPVAEDVPAADVKAEVVEPVGAPPLWSLKYPASKEQFAGDLDMTVIQDRKSIKITNRTVKTYNDVQVWVNQRYVTRVDSIPAGKTTSVALKLLMNQYGEKYPVPGLFRPDRSFPALLVELVEPNTNQRHRLIVQKTHSQF